MEDTFLSLQDGAEIVGLFDISVIRPYHAVALNDMTDKILEPGEKDLEKLLEELTIRCTSLMVEDQIELFNEAFKKIGYPGMLLRFFNNDGVLKSVLFKDASEDKMFDNFQDFSKYMVDVMEFIMPHNPEGEILA